MKRVSRRQQCCHWTILLSGIVFSPELASACDPCALYNAAQTTGVRSGSLTLSIAEQYTSYEKSDALELQPFTSGEVVRDFSNTQLSLSYDVTDTFGAQAVVPVIFRRYEEFQGGVRERSEETGFGDISLLGYAEPLSERGAERSVVLTVFGGVKLPTGDPGSIGSSLPVEEMEEAHHGSEQAEMKDENEPDFHGHDDAHGETHSRLLARTFAKHQGMSDVMGGRLLSLGTGSFDFPFGAAFMFRQDRLFVSASLQYTVRTEGSFDYRFADDILWDVGPGVYLLLEDERSLALRAAVTGERKGSDHHQGEVVEGSSMNNIGVGPRIIFTANQRWVAEGGADVIVDSEESERTVLPDFRLRLALSYRF